MKRTGFLPRSTPLRRTALKRTAFKRTVKRNSPDEQAVLDAFKAEHTFCWLCGAPDQPGSELTRLDVHHILHPNRANERCNLARLCHSCHMAYHHFDDDLKREHILWLKGKFDRAHYDRARMQALRGKKLLPVASRPPGEYLERFNERRGM